jgi:glycosyltransferase involved in cell wall biosynthesis
MRKHSGHEDSEAVIKHVMSRSYAVLRGEGLLALLIKGLQRLQRRRRRESRKHKAPLRLAVSYDDALAVDPARGLPAWQGSTRERLSYNWIMPPPAPGSGGHIGLFRLIEALERAGHECRIFLYSTLPRVPASSLSREIRATYPPVRAPMEWLPRTLEMPAADGVFATSWETAYAAYNASCPGRRFYCVQDFEPLFYPMGSEYVLAENTYRFGFYGITAGAWMADRLRRDYGMQSTAFAFGVDEDVYMPSRDGEARDVVFYARPVTARRGFELGVLALDLFRREHPDVTINFVGWDTSEHEVPFEYTNHGVLTHAELSELYARCAVALIISLTNMSLLPLELLASGVIPVVTDGPNNRMVSDNPFIEYASPTPHKLAEKMSSVLRRSDLPGWSLRAAQSVQGQTWKASLTEIVSRIEQETRRAD